MKNLLLVLAACVVAMGAQGAGAASDGMTWIVGGEESPRPQDWSADWPITPGVFNKTRPAIASAPNGDLFVAVEFTGDPVLEVYKSTNRGVTWTRILQGTVSTADELRNPSICYAEEPGGADAWLYVALSREDPGNLRRVGVLRFKTDGSSPLYKELVTSIPMTGAIYPEICSDALDVEHYYVYVTYAVQGVDHSPVYFSRTFDYGVNWTVPVDVTGASENTGWLTRPDIAHGKAGLFITFGKPGWAGTSWEKQIWVTRSENYGATWTTPLQLTSSPTDDYYPRVAAAHGRDTAVILFTKDNGSDLDIWECSTLNGSTWTGEGMLPSTAMDEYDVDVGVSRREGRFHAACTRSDSTVRYTWSDTALPGSWNTSVAVNDGGLPSANYSRPAVCAHPLKAVDKEACVVWTDFRGPTYQAYFDTPPEPPVADIKVNGTDGPLAMYRGAALKITVELRGGDWTGYDCDWWCLCVTPLAPPATWFYLDVSSALNWYPGVNVTHQGPCGNIGPLEVLDQTWLPAGDYIFYFGVDNIVSGLVDGTLHHDWVEVSLWP